MNGDIQTGKLDRLEDFVELVGQGIPVTVDIKLKKQFVKQKVHPDETDDITDELDMYLLTGEFMCSAENQIITITKMYVMGFVEESPTESNTNKNVANQRLKMDYARLVDSGIEFTEVFF